MAWVPQQTFAPVPRCLPAHAVQGKGECMFDCKEELLNSLPEGLKTTLSRHIYQYKNGVRGSYRGGKHKVSASNDWYEYAKVIQDYPRTILHENKPYNIVDMACGIRSDEDKILLVREVSIDEFAGYASVYTHDEFDFRYGFWHGDCMFYDEDADTFLHFRAEDLHLSYYSEDKAFINYWLDSVEELIVKRCWNEGHSDNSIRKLIRKYNYIKHVFESIDKEEGGDYTVCGRCYKRRCCCENSSRELTYEINVHSMSVEVSKGFRTIDLTMEEVSELASFFASAKTKIKEAKVAELEAQAEELKKKLEEAKAL